MRKPYTGRWLLTCRYWLPALFVMYSLSSSANVYNVTVTTDGNATNQLRGALLAASAAGAGPHIINIAAGTYDLTMGEIIFGNSAVDLSIIGAGSASTIIHMTTTSQDRFFLINTTGTVGNVQVTMSGLHFTGGHLTSDHFGGGAILCGGPNNAITITDCVFSDNTIDGTAGGNGGAIAMTGGGALTIDRCTFSDNSLQTGSGGALYYSSFNTYSGSLAITNSLFSDNQSNGAGGAGGALSVVIQGALAGTTSSVIIQKNNFLFNLATTDGGAMMIINSFSPSNTALFNYNRLSGNFAGHGATSAIGVGSAQGNVDATNNWWGCNAGPASPTGCDKAAITGSGGAGTLGLSPWLQLTTTSAAFSICSGNAGNSTVVTAGFMKNSSGTIIPASNLTAFAGTTVSFSATLGTLSGSQNVFQSDGTATTTFTSNGTTGGATVNPVADNVPANDATAMASIAVNAPLAIPNVSSSGTGTVSVGNSYISDGSCNRIARVLPSGAAPVSGTVTARVTVGTTQPVTSDGQPYVQRYFDIEPATNAALATATLTLYVPQSEFDSYNAAMPGTVNDLPTGPSDAIGKANLHVTQLHGTGTPGNYTGWTGSGPAAVLINPGASNVQWNSTTHYWEITFDVTGFSGFYITGLISSPLPVKLESFTAENQPQGVRIHWIVDEEANVNRYEIGRSTDGRTYTPVGTMQASHQRQYEYWDTNPLEGASYYRLAMIDNDGRSNYSQVVALNRSIAGWSVQAAPNPFRDALQMRIDAPDGGTVSLELLDLAGRLLRREVKAIQKGSNVFLLSGLGEYGSGIYFLRIEGLIVQQTVKLVKY